MLSSIEKPTAYNSVAFSPDGRFIASGSDDNTVKLWNIENFSNFLLLWSSREGLWLLINNNELVFRAEYGNLLRKKTDNADWLPIFPTEMKPLSDLSISINPSEFSISTGEDNEAELSVEIRNTGPAATFWLKLKPTQSEDSLVRLDAPDNQLKAKGQNPWKTAHITRLEAGATATLHGRISTNLNFPAEFIPPGIRPLTVTVVSANGTEVSQTIDVEVNLPRLKWQQATLGADGSTLKVALQNTGTAAIH